MQLLIMFTFSLLGGWLFPWWWPAVAGLALGFLMAKRPGSAFVTGFLGAAMAWLLFAAYRDWQNHHVLAVRIAALFHLPSGPAVVASTALLGGIIGGLGAWTGFSWRRYFKPH